MIYPEDLEDLGLEKLLAILEMETKEELAFHMIETENLTLDELAESLSEDICVCPRCGDDFAFLTEGICFSCRMSLS